MGRRPLRLLLVVVGIVTVILAIEAAYLWFQPDETGSLALATAVATFALAFAAILTIDQNSALVQAALEEAKASSDEAKASRETLEEMQRQRELAYRPWLTVTRVWIPASSAYDVGYRVYRVTNIGAGPAVDIVLAGVQKNPSDAVRVWSWMASENPGMAPGDSWDIRADFGPTPAGEPRVDRYRCLTDDLVGTITAGEIVAVRYQDLFGTHYLASPDVRALLRPEEWRGGSTAQNAPNWLRCQ